MQRDTLNKIIKACEQRLPAVLVTRLHTGEQTFYLKDQLAGGSTVSDFEKTMALQALRDDRCSTHENDEGQLFFQIFNPPFKLFIIGAVHIAQELLPMAAQCHYEISLIDPRGAFASEQRFPGITIIDEWPDKALEKLKPDERTAVITLTHDPKLDEPALEIALRSPVFYIGSLGSKRTHAARLTRMKDRGFTDQELRRIHGPIGLDIGARSPAEIAVSIIGQLTQAKHAYESERVAA